MPREIFSNNAIAQLSQPLHVGDDRVYVDDLDVFPDPKPGEYFTAVIIGENCQSAEIVEIAGKGPQWLIASQRGAHGSTEQEFVQHARVVHQLTAGSLQSITDDYLQFSGLYAGAFDADPPPTTPDRNPGTLYFNTATGAMRVYMGSNTWRDIAVPAPADSTRWVYVLTAGDDPINIAGVDIYGNTLNLDATRGTLTAVYVNGVRQVETVGGYLGDYTVDKPGNRIVMAKVQPVNTTIHVVEHAILDAANLPAHDAAHDPHNDARYVALQPAGWRSVTVDPGGGGDYRTLQEAFDAESKKHFRGSNYGLVVNLADGSHIAPADTWGMQPEVFLIIQGNPADHTAVRLNAGLAASPFLNVATSGVTHLKWLAFADDTAVLGASAKTGLYVSGPGRVVVEDCDFSKLRAGLNIHQAAHVLVQRCAFRNRTGDGIRSWFGGQQIWIDGCTFDNCIYSGVAVHGAGNTIFSGAPTTIRNCRQGIHAARGAYVEVLAWDATVPLTIDQCALGVEALLAATVMMGRGVATNSPDAGNAASNYSPFLDGAPGNDGARIFHSGVLSSDNDDGSEKSRTALSRWAAFTARHHP